jgi:hypothetical protein
MIDPRIPKRSTTICIIATVVIAVFLFFYGRPIALLLLTKWQIRNKPELWIVPMPLPTSASEPSPGRTFSYLGYDFESPWTEVKLEKKYRLIATVYFSDGEFISISKGPDVISAMQEGSAKRRRTLQDVFGAGVMDSNYKLRSSILYSTPRDLRLFSSPRETVAQSVLLTLKPMSVMTAKSGLYSFQSRWLRGFEEGKPGQANPVAIDAFDEKDREIDILIGTQLHTNGTVSQADINRVLFSLRPVPTAPTE